MAFLFMRLFRVVILVCLVCSVIHYLITNKSYTFSPRELRKIAELYAGQHPKESTFKIANDLRRKYHPHIIPDAEQEWFLGSFGGIHLKFLFLHASLTERLLIAGSPLPMEGSLGSHWSNESCSVLSGSVHAFRSGSLQLREEYGPGEFIRHLMGETVVMQSTEETWMLCYARGFIPASLPLSLTSNIMGAGDIVQPAKYTAAYLQNVVRELAFSVSETMLAQLRQLGLAK